MASKNIDPLLVEEPPGREEEQEKTEEEERGARQEWSRGSQVKRTIVSWAANVSAALLIRSKRWRPQKLVTIKPPGTK